MLLVVGSDIHRQISRLILVTDFGLPEQVIISEGLLSFLNR